MGGGGQQLVGLKQLTVGGRGASAALGAIAELLQNTSDAAVRSAATAAVMRISAPAVYSARDVQEVRAAAEMHSTRSATYSVDRQGDFSITARVAGNGVNFLVVEPVND